MNVKYDSDNVLQIGNQALIHADCFDVFPFIEDKSIGIEKEQKYFNIAVERLNYNFLKKIKKSKKNKKTFFLIFLILYLIRKKEKEKEMKIQTKVSISQMHETQMKMKYLNDALNTNRLALVTGAYSDGQQTNICWEIAKKLKADNGIKILSCDRKNIAYPVNLLDARERKQWLHHSLAQNPDILILGHADMALKWFEDYSESEIDYLLDESLISHLKIVREFINATIDKPYKKYIVFIGSMAYDNVLNGSIPYMVAKAGIATAVKGLAWELASKNYNVIGIHPSNTHDTPMTEQTIQEIVKFRGVSYEDAAAYWGATCPKGRFLTKTELANFVSFFISGTCDYLSGANIEFKGGQR